MTIKQRIEQIEKQTGAGKDFPRTWIDLMYWEYNRKEANGGKLSPEDQAKAKEYLRRFLAGGKNERVWNH